MLECSQTDKNSYKRDLKKFKLKNVDKVYQELEQWSHSLLKEFEKLKKLKKL